MRTGENLSGLDLQRQLDAFKQRFIAAVPPEAVAVVLETTEELVRSGIAAQAIREGMRAPDFALTDMHGRRVALSELLAEGPAVVAFYRGVW